MPILKKEYVIRIPDLVSLLRPESKVDHLPSFIQILRTRFHATIAITITKERRNTILKLEQTNKGYLWIQLL